MDKVYREMIEQIKLDVEEYADEEMKPIYTQQKKSLDELHASIGTLFIAFAIDGLLKMNASQKAATRSNFDDKLKIMGKNLGDAEVKKVTDILSKAYEDTYYKNAFCMQSGLKIELKFDILKKGFIEAAVNQKFKEELFSDRIWKNKADMIDKLSSSITECMKGNTTIDKIGRDIRNTFNVTAYQSQRLVLTENARIQTQASHDIGVNTGVKQVMWSATLDGKTCEEDAALDGKIFPIDEAPDCPQHPNCRCAIINVPAIEGWQPTQRKNNETKDIIDYKNYESWLKNKSISEN